MELLEKILDSLPQGKVVEVCMGLHWTMVGVEVNGMLQYGLGSTVMTSDENHHMQPDVPLAGKLTDLTALDLAKMVLSETPTAASIGMATINALLPRQPEAWVDANAEEMIAARGADKKVALIGHFPFVNRLATRVGTLKVLELNPHPGDHPAVDAELILPQSDVIAITGMTLINHTFPQLLALCPAGAFVMILGPSSPLSPVLFDFGVSLVSGSIITNTDAVKRTALQGGHFRQLHQAGVRLVNIMR